MVLRGPALLLNRLAAAAHLALGRVDTALRELPVVLSSPELASRLTLSYFRHARQYVEPSQQTRGLFPFEQRMVERFFPKPPGRVLVHGAGAGREPLALVELGYRVEAYEPVAMLASAGQRLLRERGLDVPLRVATIQSWAENVATTAPCDAVFLGWATWSHLLRSEERVSALRAFRRICPRGPVLMSFYRNDALYDLTERGETGAELVPFGHRISHALRHGLRERVLRLPPVERGTTWAAGYFYHAVEAAELEAEAALGGYQVAFWEADPRRYPHAVLQPKA
jgi:hypothetical protein